LKNKFEPIDSTLKSLMKKYNLESKFYEYIIVKDWEKITTKKISNFVKPVQLNNQVLVCEVKSELLRNELMHQKSVLIEMVSSYIKPFEILDIQFR
jgi:hypothetical protein